MLLIVYNNYYPNSCEQYFRKIYKIKYDDDISYIIVKLILKN